MSYSWSLQRKLVLNRPGHQFKRPTQPRKAKRGEDRSRGKENNNSGRTEKNQSHRGNPTEAEHKNSSTRRSIRNSPPRAKKWHKEGHSLRRPLCPRRSQQRNKTTLKKQIEDRKGKHLKTTRSTARHYDGAASRRQQDERGPSSKGANVWY